MISIASITTNLNKANPWPYLKNKCSKIVENTTASLADTFSKYNSTESPAIKDFNMRADELLWWAGDHLTSSIKEFKGQTDGKSIRNFFADKLKGFMGNIRERLPIKENLSKMVTESDNSAMVETIVYRGDTPMHTRITAGAEYFSNNGFKIIELGTPSRSRLFPDLNLVVKNPENFGNRLFGLGEKMFSRWLSRTLVVPSSNGEKIITSRWNSLGGLKNCIIADAKTGKVNIRFSNDVMKWYSGTGHDRIIFDAPKKIIEVIRNGKSVWKIDLERKNLTPSEAALRGELTKEFEQARNMVVDSLISNESKIKSKSLNPAT